MFSDSPNERCSGVRSVTPCLLDLTNPVDHTPYRSSSCNHQANPAVVENIFQSLDVNGDGVVSVQEFTDGLKNLTEFKDLFAAPPPPAAPEGEEAEGAGGGSGTDAVPSKVFDEDDFQSDGVMTWAEFQAWCAAKVWLPAA